MIETWIVERQGQDLQMFCGKHAAQQAKHTAAQNPGCRAVQIIDGTCKVVEEPKEIEA